MRIFGVGVGWGGVGLGVPENSQIFGGGVGGGRGSPKICMLFCVLINSVVLIFYVFGLCFRTLAVILVSDFIYIFF